MYLSLAYYVLIGLIANPSMSCGNFLDPCGGIKDEPCCAPDFCKDGLCYNSTTMQKQEVEGNYIVDVGCGNFLDPCGGTNNPPCCSPDFCFQGQCINATMALRRK